MKPIFPIISFVWMLLSARPVSPGTVQPKDAIDGQHAIIEVCAQPSNRASTMYPELLKYIEAAEQNAETIPAQRMANLERIALYIQQKNQSHQTGNLTFICTHNSRRSHMCQIWAETGAAYYGIADRVRTYSGGTEATAFNPRAVAAMRRAGFSVEDPGGENPRYMVSYGANRPVMACFSKTFDHPVNPERHFAAVMTCSEADRNCPLVPGAELRVSIPYEDPKIADGTGEESSKYDQRCRQIATEMLYLMSLVKR